jgi:phosphotriesterase-related protein
MDGQTAGNVMTVLGPVEPRALGPTLVHEHVFIDLRHASFVPPPDGLEGIVEARAELVERSLLERYSCSVRDNLVLDDLGVAVAELQAFAAAGGGCIVDVSPPDIGRSPALLAAASQRTGVAVVMGCGHYCEIGYPEGSVLGKREAELCDEIVGELREGVGDDRVRPGIIGEIGVNGEERGTRRLVGEMTESERRVLRAGAAASRLTGAPMTVHLPARDSAVPAVLDELADAAAPLGQVSLSHMDTISDVSLHEEALDRGVWIQYDCFGMALQNDWYADPGDDRRCDWLDRLRTSGRLYRVLVSHDVWCKAQLSAYGGAGYDHLLTTIRPKLVRRGFTDVELDRLFVQAPAEFLTWAEPGPSR